MPQPDDLRDFIVRRGAALSRTAFLLTGNHAEAEDLVQEALIKAAARWTTLTARGDPEAWVRKVMLNDLRDWRRPRRMRMLSSDRLPELPDEVDRTAQSDARIALMRALAQLGPRQRAVLYLRYYEDLSEAETARQLGCTLGTVKRQTHDALERLRAVAPQLGAVGDHREVAP